MKKLLCMIVCLCLLVPCAFAEELPRAIGENDADYAWLYENSLVVAERFQWGLDCTWHSFLLSAANVPEQEMLSALAPLRLQDYSQPTAVTFVRADQLLPDEMIEAWKAALKAEEEAKAARAALRSAELVNELAIVKLANAEEAVLKTAEEAVKAAEEAFKAAEEAAKLAEEEAAESAKKEEKIESPIAEITAQTAKEIAQAAEEAFSAAEEAAQAVKELEKGEAFLAAKSAAKAAEKTSKTVKNAKKAVAEAVKAAAEEAEAEETPDPANAAEPAEKTEKKEKTPAELAAETAAARIEAAVAAADKASKAAEEAFKAEANAIQAAQTLADLQAGKFTADTADDAGLEFSDDVELEDDSIPTSGDGAETGSDADYWDLDWDNGLDGAPSEDDWDLDWDWDDWDLDNGEGSASAPQPEKKKIWFIEEDPQRDLYHCAPKVLNYNEDDKMFSGISDAIQVAGFYLRDEALDGPLYAVTYYGGLYALLITYYPAGDGFVSVSAQVIYSRSADALCQPTN